MQASPYEALSRTLEHLAKPCKILRAAHAVAEISALCSPRCCDDTVVILRRTQVSCSGLDSAKLEPGLSQFSQGLHQCGNPMTQNRARLHTGMGIRRSWFMTAVPKYTSPIAPPRFLKPPAVPALMSRSGLNACSARYAVSAAGTVPTWSTLWMTHLPAHCGGDAG